MYLMRLSLPDRPGSLGMVAAALGDVGVDIHAVEIIERNGGSAVNDFLVKLAPRQLPDSIVSACRALDGVTVEWISRYPGGRLQSDLELLGQVIADPARAVETLVAAAPIVFRSHWALVVNVASQPRVALSTPMSPDLDADQLIRFAPFDTLHRVDLGDGWLPGWGESHAAVAPTVPDGAIVVVRQGGPVFRNSELARLGHLVALALSSTAG